METVYVRINWQNQPSTATALGATNLNKIDLALSIIDGRVVAINTTKLDVSVANTLVQDVTVDDNGVFTIKKLDGSTTKYDTKLEKIAVNFTYDSATQKIVITLDDGTKQYVDLSSLITEYEFTDSSTIGFTVTDGKVSASVKNGSITAEKLQPNYLADIKVQAQNAQNSANASADSASLAKRYAIGIDTETEKDSAKYFMEQAKQYRDEAQDISGVGIAAESKLGLVKGNGNVSIQADGSMWANEYKDKGTATGTFINFKNADDALAQINVKGITTAIPTNPDLPISPDNKLNLSSPLNFDLVSHNDNYMPKASFTTRTTNGVTGVLNPDGSITLDGTATANADFLILGAYGTTKSTISLSSGKYWVRGTGNANVGYHIGYNASGIMEYTSSADRSTTLIVDKIISYIILRVNKGTTVSNMTVYPQISKGETISPYTPYKEDRINIPLDLGEWNDIKDGGYVKGAEEVIYDGSTDEIWGVSNKTSNKLVFAIAKNDALIQDATGNILCDKFLNVSLNTLTSENNIEGVALRRGSISGIVVCILKSRLSGYSESLSDLDIAVLFKEWLKTNILNCRYKTANAIITPLNTYLKTFKGVTNIFTNATPQPEITATFKPQLWADLYNHQNAINSKIDDKKRVNNLLSTDPTTVLSGAMGKQLKDEIDATNNNMPKQINYWSDTQKNLLAKINDVSDPTFRTVIINGWDSVFTDSDMPYRNTVWHIAIYNNGRDINVWQRWTNLDNGSIYMRLYNPSSSSWGNWINNDLKSVTYTGTTESYATPNGKYAYLALPVAKDSAKNLLVNVVNDEYIVHATYHNAYNWLALITKVDDSVPLSTSLTVNYTLIN